tara:strand:+ start:244 stop:1206 length:963 start_codon:yes stop_codon:yes gene_type:complete
MKYEEVGPWEELAEDQKDAFQKALNNSPSALGSYVAVYDSVFSEEECEKIIDFYKKSTALGFSYEGVSGLGGVNKDAKDSVDLQIFVAGNQPCPPYLHHEIDDEFYKWLQNTFKDRVMSCCYQYYTEVNTALMYESWYGIKPYLKTSVSPTMMDANLIRLQSCQIQKFPANGNGYPAVHTETDTMACRGRVLAPILYLNTIDRELGGATRIPLAQREVQPKAGSLVIMPADFPFFHLGCQAEVDKYIITTWLEHAPLEDQLRYYETVARNSGTYIEKLENKLFKIDKNHKEMFENVWKTPIGVDLPSAALRWRWDDPEEK